MQQANPRLGDVRGKIVLLARFRADDTGSYSLPLHVNIGQGWSEKYEVKKAENIYVQVSCACARRVRA